MPDDEDGEFLGYAVSGVIGGALSDILKGIISGMIVEILSYLSIEVERINDRILVTLFIFSLIFILMSYYIIKAIKYIREEGLMSKILGGGTPANAPTLLQPNRNDRIKYDFDIPISKQETSVLILLSAFIGSVFAIYFGLSGAVVAGGATGILLNMFKRRYIHTS